MEPDNQQAPRGLVVAVVGSRRIKAARALVVRLAALRAAGELAEVVSGGAAGVDRLAAAWAWGAGVKLTERLPDYARHGRAAPHIRNAELVAAADRVLVVWDGRSKGTLSAARHAVRLGKPMEWLLAPAPADLAAATAARATSPADGGQLGLFGGPLPDATAGGTHGPPTP